MPPKSVPARSVDGFIRQPLVLPNRPVPPPAPATPRPAAVAPRRRTFTAPPQRLPRHRLGHALLYSLGMVLCLSASFFAQSLPLGMAAIAVYAAVAWLRRLPGRYSFILAFSSLITVVVLLLVRQNVELAGNFATYTFLLLVVGIVSSMLESGAYPKRKRSKIRH